MTDKLPGKRASPPRLLEPGGGGRGAGRGATHMEMQPSVYTRPIFLAIFLLHSPFFAINSKCE